MKLLTFHLKNFLQYADTQIAFEPGVTAIVGANGAGKTTLLEAIARALYGYTETQKVDEMSVTGEFRPFY